MPLTYRLYHMLWTGLDWLFPPICAGCQRAGYRWCPDCRKNTPRPRGTICERCGQMLRRAGLCKQCKMHKPAYTAARSWGLHEGPLRQALHQLKYKRDIGLGEALADELVMLVKEQGWQIDIVVAVPLGRERLRQRGYNQAALLANPLAMVLGLSYQPQGLKRVRETSSQVGLSRQQRRENVEGAFNANKDIVENKNVLLVDDVMTTGATINAAAAALRESGAAQVWAVTLARAV